MEILKILSSLPSARGPGLTPPNGATRITGLSGPRTADGFRDRRLTPTVIPKPKAKCVFGERKQPSEGIMPLAHR